MLITKINGVNKTIKTKITPAQRSDIFSEDRVAEVFGVISPKIRIKKVIIPVAAPTISFPNSLDDKRVVKEEAYIFTMLFPIRIAPSILPGSPVTFRTMAARESPASANVLMRILFTVVRAVSDDEKNAERATKIRIINNCMASLDSKKINLYFLFCQLRLLPD